MEKTAGCDLDKKIAALEAELRALKVNAPHQPFGAMLRHVFDFNIIPMSRASSDGRMYNVNQAYADLVGYTREELTSGEITWDDITPPEQRYLNWIAVDEISAAARATPFEKEYLRKDGTRVAVLVAITSLDTTGTDNLVMALDLSAIRRAEMKLKKSEEQFRMLVDSVPQIVFVGSSDAKLHYFNQRWKDFTGLDDNQGLDMAWTDLIHPEDLPGLMDRWQESADEGKEFQLEFRHRYKDGSYHWSICRSVPVFDENGNVLRWIGTLTNIDERRRVQKGLEQQERHFRMLAEGVPQIIWTAEADGRIDFFNHRWLEYTGLSIDQSMSGAWRLLIHPADLVEYDNKWNHAIQSGETYEHEFRLKRVVGLQTKAPESRYLWHLCRAVAFRNSAGRIIKWVGTWTDIHEQKA